MRQQRQIVAWRALWLLAALMFCGPGLLYAQEHRVALLVANQQGWKGDPRLSYVLKGDLRPLASSLRRLGFLVKTLENKNVDALRQAFGWAQKTLASHQQATFLFYYSGHADQRYFHLGPKTKKPMSYKEFARLLSGLQTRRRIAIIDSCYSGEIIRQFGSLGRYKKLFQRGRRKGVRAKRALHIRKLLLPEQGKELGVRIISSSLDFSWELDRYKASIFTYHLLRGLRHAADLNKDGKITVDELFDFASREVHQETGQRPQQLVLIKREQPYALAPAYNSRLWIGPKVVGKLKVAVANFLWQKNKRGRQPLRLAVVDGKATVFLRRQKQCWRQQVMIPKGGEARLSRRWRSVPCRRWARVRKGSVVLAAMGSDALAAILRERRSSQRDLSLALSTGFAYVGAASLQAPHLQVGALLRWRWLGIGFHYMAGFPGVSTFWLSRFLIHAELGWPIPFSIGGTSWRFFPGAFFRVGTAVQHPQEGDPRQVIVLGTGAKLSLSWWTSERFGLRLNVLAGVDYAPVRGSSGFSPLIQINAAALIAF